MAPLARLASPRLDIGPHTVPSPRRDVGLPLLSVGELHTQAHTSGVCVCVCGPCAIRVRVTVMCVSGCTDTHGVVAAQHCAPYTAITNKQKRAGSKHASRLHAIRRGCWEARQPALTLTLTLTLTPTLTLTLTLILILTLPLPLPLPLTLTLTLTLTPNSNSNPDCWEGIHPAQ